MPKGFEDVGSKQAGGFNWKRKATFDCCKVERIVSPSVQHSGGFALCFGFVLSFLSREFLAAMALSFFFKARSEWREMKECNTIKRYMIILGVYHDPHATCSFQ